MHLQWTTVGSVDVDIGANPSAEEADEGVDDSARKVVDIIDSFRLVVGALLLASCSTPARCVQYHAHLTGLTCLPACRSNPRLTRRPSWAGQRCAAAQPPPVSAWLTP